MKSKQSMHKQSGAALVVGMMLLLVLTLLAVSAVNTASTELVMAGNTQFQSNAFQAAETGITLALRNGGFNPAAAPEITAATAVTGSTTEFYSTTVSPQLGGNAQPAIWGNTWDSFSTFHFQIDSNGTSIRNAVANTFQGVAVIAPKDPTVTPLDPTSTALTP